jgi:cobyrinic acid a,c-diamide synthase
MKVIEKRRISIMVITPQNVADQLGRYLRHESSVKELVDWAERQVMDGDFESQTVRDAVARLGVADVRAFGLTWDDCQEMLRDLGFDAHVHIATAS